MALDRTKRRLFFSIINDESCICIPSEIWNEHLPKYMRKVRFKCLTFSRSDYSVVASIHYESADLAVWENPRDHKECLIG